MTSNPNHNEKSDPTYLFSISNNIKKHYLPVSVGGFSPKKKTLVNCPNPKNNYIYIQHSIINNTQERLSPKKRKTSKKLNFTEI